MEVRLGTWEPLLGSVAAVLIGVEDVRSVAEKRRDLRFLASQALGGDFWVDCLEAPAGSLDPDDERLVLAAWGDLAEGRKPYLGVGWQPW